MIWGRSTDRPLRPHFHEQVDDFLFTAFRRQLNLLYRAFHFRFVWRSYFGGRSFSAQHGTARSAKVAIGKEIILLRRPLLAGLN